MAEDACFLCPLSSHCSWVPTWSLMLGPDRKEQVAAGWPFLRLRDLAEPQSLSSRAPPKLPALPPAFLHPFRPHPRLSPIIVEHLLWAGCSSRHRGSRERESKAKSRLSLLLGGAGTRGQGPCAASPSEPGSLGCGQSSGSHRRDWGSISCCGTVTDALEPVSVACAWKWTGAFRLGDIS